MDVLEILDLILTYTIDIVLGHFVAVMNFSLYQTSLKKFL